MNPYFTPRCPGCQEPLTRDHHFRRRLLFTLALTVGLVAPTITRAGEDTIIITRAAVEEKSDHEWIEIQNVSDAPVDITGWKFFEDEANHKLTVVQGDVLLEPGERAIIADVADVYRADHPDFDGTLFDSAWDSLSETGEEIALKDASGLIVTTFWTGPSAVEEPTVTTSTPAQSSASAPPSVLPAIPTSDFRYPPPRVVINELFPNPTDRAADEWIELKNLGGIPASVSGWTLSDGTTRYKIPAIVIDAGMNAIFERRATNIALQNRGKETVELLNSDGERVDRVQYDAKETAGLAYARLPDGSFEWTVHPTAHGPNDHESPNRPPQIVVDGPREVLADELTIFDASDTIDPDRDAVSFAWTIEGTRFGPGPMVEYRFSKPGKQRVLVEAKDARGATTIFESSVLIRGLAVEAATLPTPNKTEKEKKVAIKKQPVRKSSKTLTVEGMVTALPGTTNKRSMFIQTENGGVFEIYQHKGLFPTLSLDDTVTASGRISESDNQRLIVKSAEDIKILDADENATATAVSVAELDGVMRGALVLIGGEVVEISRAGAAIDDGTGELTVAQPRAGWPVGLEAGARLTATGILLKQPSGVKIVPRTIDDIKITVSSTLSAAAPAGAKNARRPLPHPAVPLLATGLGLTGAGLIVRRLRPATRSPP